MQRAKLTPSEVDAEDVFGASAALSADGSTALLGAPNDEDPRGDRAGSAYVFARDTDGWGQQAKLAAGDGDGGDTFATSVSLSGDGSTALLGAPFDEDPNGSEAGAAYVFVRGADGWAPQAKLAATDGAFGDGFGDSVALAGDGSTALLGAPNNKGGHTPADGSAYVFGPGDSGGGSGGGGGGGPTATPTPTTTSAGDPMATTTGRQTATTAATPGDTADTAEGVPGFGPASALAGLGGAGYLVYRRITDRRRQSS